LVRPERPFFSFLFSLFPGARRSTNEHFALSARLGLGSDTAAASDPCMHQRDRLLEIGVLYIIQEKNVLFFILFFPFFTSRENKESGWLERKRRAESATNK